MEECISFTIDFQNIVDLGECIRYNRNKGESYLYLTWDKY